MSNNLKAKLTYAIENAERDVTFIFKYSYNNVDKNYLENPFEICNGNDCQDKITTYDFKKGESYKIYVKHISVFNGFGSYTAFPCFSFYDKTKEKESSSYNIVFNIWTICLLLLFIF